MFGLHASPSSRFLSRVAPILPRLRRLDLSCPGGLPPDELLSLKLLTNLEEAQVAASLHLFGRQLEEAMGSESKSTSTTTGATNPIATTITSASSSTVIGRSFVGGPECTAYCAGHFRLPGTVQNPALVDLLRDAFVNVFRLHFPPTAMDSTFPRLRTLRVTLHGSRGLANFTFTRNCLD